MMEVLTIQSPTQNAQSGPMGFNEEIHWGTWHISSK